MDQHDTTDRQHAFNAFYNEVVERIIQRAEDHPQRKHGDLPAIHGAAYDFVDDLDGDSTELRTKVGELEDRLTRAARIIEVADLRAAAVDGPVSHAREEMTDDEWRELYLAITGVTR